MGRSSDTLWLVPHPTESERGTPVPNSSVNDAKVAALNAKARNLNAEAEQFETFTAKTKLDLERDQEKRAKEKVSDYENRVYRFHEGVDNSSSEKCRARLAEWHRLDPNCDIEIEFYSPGGSVHAGMALFDAIQELRRAGHEVTTSTVGYAASMGGILLQAGDHRVMGKESYILIHEVQAAALGTMGEIDDEVTFLKMIQKRILKIFEDRSNLTYRQLKNRWERKNWWLDSDEALKLGIVDEVR